MKRPTSASAAVVVAVLASLSAWWNLRAFQAATVISQSAHEIAERRQRETLDHRDQSPSNRPPCIGVVQLLTKEVVSRFSLAVSQVGCWAARHGYYHHVETYNPMPGNRLLVRDSKIIYVRKYLPYVDWLLLLDADVDVANMACRLESYIPDPSLSTGRGTGWRGDFDVVLGVREHTGEPMSGAVLLRNSAWGWDFLRRWERHMNETPGADNESMISALLGVLDGALPNHTLPCAYEQQRYRCLYEAAGGKVGRLPHVMLTPAFHFLLRSLWKASYGYFPNYCLVHGKNWKEHLRPEHALCPQKQPTSGEGGEISANGTRAEWARPELALSLEEARESIRNFVKEHRVGKEASNGAVKHALLSECYPDCLEDPRVSWT